MRAYPALVSLAILTCLGQAAASQPAVHFRLQVGDEAVYEGQASQVSKSDHYGTHSARASAKITVLTYDRDDQGYYKTGQSWQVEPEKGSSKGFETAAPFETTRLESKGFNLADRAWTKWAADYLDPTRFLPSPPKDGLKVGDRWSAWAEVGGRAQVSCHAAAVEDVAGRSCLRVDITPAGPLPAPVKSNAFYEGGPAPKVTVTCCEGHLWLARENGWTVKFEQSSELRSEQPDNARYDSTSERSVSLTLVSARRVEATEFQRLSDQLAGIRYVQRYLYTGGNYSPSEGAQIALRRIESLRRRYPDSPYAPVLAALEQRSREITEQVAKGRKPDDGQRAMVGKQAPDFTAKTMDGRQFKFAALRGKPAVIFFMNLNFDFAEQCFADIEALYREWKPKGVQMIGVVQGGRKKDREELARLTFTILDDVDWSNRERLRQLHDPYEMYTSMGAVVLGSRGKVRYHRWGFYPKELRKALTEALK